MPYERLEYLAMSGSDYIWIWRGLVPLGGSTLLFGEPKKGKSLFALSLAEAVADPNASTHLGYPVDQHGRVLYIQLDMPRALWQSYVAKTRPIEGLWFIDREDPELPREFDIRHIDHRDWMARQVAAVSPLLVIADTLRALHRGDENDSTTMQAVYTALLDAIGGASLILVAHDNKPQQNDNRSSVARLRGSSYVAGAVDAVLHLVNRGVRVAARSDVEWVEAERDAGGMFHNVREALTALPPDTPQAEKDRIIAERFNMSERTARRRRGQLLG